MNTCHGHSSGNIDSSLDTHTFQSWAEDGDPWTNDAEVMNTNEHMNYVDLSKNPERFTGYSGPSAARIWNAIYDENCFVAQDPSEGAHSATTEAEGLHSFVPPVEQCLEKRVFYRIVSGLHSSISTHLCHDYSYDLSSQVFEPNVDRFYETVAKYPVRVHNLYLTYLMVLRAISKALPALQSYSPPGTPIQDLLQQLSQVSTACPNTFDENAMFQGPDAPLLKAQFKNHFRNISVILDCVACERCKLWGKLQINGLGTALRILFDTKQQPDLEKLSLERTELVALIHTFRRLSESLKWSNEMFKVYRAQHGVKKDLSELLKTEQTIGKIVAEATISSSKGDKIAENEAVNIQSADFLASEQTIGKAVAESTIAAFGGDKGPEDDALDTQVSEPYTNHDQSPQYDQPPQETVVESSSTSATPTPAQTSQDEPPRYENNEQQVEEYNETEELERRVAELEKALQQQAQVQPDVQAQAPQVDLPVANQPNHHDDYYNETEELEYQQYLLEQQEQAQRAALENHQIEPQVPDLVTQDLQEKPVEEVQQVQEVQQVESPIEVQQEAQQIPEVEEVTQTPQETLQPPELPEVIDMLLNPPKTPFVPDVMDDFQVDLQQVEQETEKKEEDAVPTEQVPEMVPELPEVIDLLKNPPKTPFVPDVLEDFQAEVIEPEIAVGSTIAEPASEIAPELPTTLEMLLNPPMPVIPDVKDEFVADIPAEQTQQEQEVVATDIPVDPISTPEEQLETPTSQVLEPEIETPAKKEEEELYSATMAIPPLPEAIETEQNVEQVPDVPSDDPPLHVASIESPGQHISVAGADTQVVFNDQQQAEEQVPQPAVIETPQPVVPEPQIPVTATPEPDSHPRQHQEEQHQEEQHHNAHEHQHGHSHDHDHHGHNHGHGHHGHDHGHGHGHSHMMGMDSMMGGGMGMDGHGGHGGPGHNNLGGGRDLSSEHYDDTWNTPQPEGFDAVLATVMDAWTVTKVAVRNFYTRVILPAVKQNSSMYSALAVIFPILIFFVLALRRKVEAPVPFANPTGATSPTKRSSNKTSSFAPAPAFTRPDSLVQAPHTPSKGPKDDGARSRRGGPAPIQGASKDPSLPFAPASASGHLAAASIPHVKPAGSSRRVPPSTGPNSAPNHSPFVPPVNQSAKPSSSTGPSPSKMAQPAPSHSAAPSASQAPAPSASNEASESLINTTTPPPFNASAMPMPGMRSGAPKAAAASGTRRRSIPVPEPLKK